VILSGGTYGSAGILLHSGVGPSADVRSLGIEVLGDLPVGQRLQDHPMLTTVYALAPQYLQMTPNRAQPRRQRTQHRARILHSRRALRNSLRLGSPTAPAITGDDHGPATVVIAIDTGNVRDADVWEVS
jgi:choline dehydrogenase-like flavoprotein